MSRTLFFVALVPSVILHEISHGAVALVFGDDTAKKAGRLSLNPIRHIDPFGTVILPAMMLFATGAAFGYAKPVPVNVTRLRNPRQQSLLVSLAGPGTNIALALIATVALRVLYGQDYLSEPAKFLLAFGFVNVILAAFNLIPIPPLDGSAMIERLLPASWWPGWLRFRQYSMGLLFLVIFLLPGALNRLFDHALNVWERFL